MSLWEMSIWGAVLIIAVSILRLFCINRLPKQLFTALWFLALLRLVLPIGIPLPLPYRENSAVSRLFEEITPALQQEAVLTAEHGAGTELLSIIWSVGFVLSLLWLTGVWIRTKKSLGPMIPAGEYRGIPVCMSENIMSPMTYGIFRPVILIPIGMEQDIRLEFIFAHEYAHIRRFDPQIKILLGIALALHWFNPAVWLMYVLYNRDMELAADEAVLRPARYQNRKAYAMTLIDMKEQAQLSSTLCSHFSKSAIEERILAIMKSKPFSPMKHLIALVLILCGAAVFFTATAEADQSVPAPVPTETMASVLTEESEPLTPVWPTISKDITVTFGERTHPVTGEVFSSDHITIRCQEGDAVYSAISGTVAVVGFDSEYGNYLLISDGNGCSTAYGHLQSVTVEQGAAITAGDIIGAAGKTGTATGPCLMFALFDGETAVDPMNLYQ